MNEGRLRRKRRALIAATLTTALGLGIAPGTAGATAPHAPNAGPPAPTQVPLPGLAPGSHQLTLVTGDRLMLDGTGDGQFTVTVDQLAPRPAGQPVASIEVVSDGDAVYAYPEDVRPAVESGRLDRTLFDVTYLVAHGLTDAASGQLPLIVEYGSTRGFAAAEALPASEATRQLESIGGAAVSVSKQDANTFWAALHSGSNGGTLRAGVQKVWLDGVAELTLDVSAPLIGAPAAWQAGVDGTGTTVAVLDTGADLGHPDLAGQIVATQSFIPDQDVQDTYGHGTHVATTIAGTGAASSGRYTGVAPGAKLLVGKVCTADGCPFSSIMDGMEWAAANGADVVSMSLGGAPSDGTDPLSQAVNQLTAASGALFVIAAGNRGPADGTVSSPSAADAALSVAATSKTDSLASFSGRGPRLDGGLKPDIAAPGVQIIAGRAEGTTMPGAVHVGEQYTTVSGTSMATPHVAGAAALVAQQHPDWQAEQLRPALMSTSQDVGRTVYETGAGRVDVAKAVSQQVVAATAKVDIGEVDPGVTTEPVTEQFSYTNTGDTPVTLSLRRTLTKVGGDPVPSDTFTGDDTVTVPAHGTATASVTVDPDPLDPGRYTGAIVATDNPTGTSLTIPVGLVRQPPTVPITIRVLDRDGQPVTAFPILWAVNVPGVMNVTPRQVERGVWQARVLAGTYSVYVGVSAMDPETSVNGRAYLIEPELTVDGPTEVTLDARDARAVTMRTPQPSTPFGKAVTYARSRWDGSLMSVTNVGGYSFGQFRTLVTPTEKVRDGALRFMVAPVLSNPQISMRVTGKDGFDLELFHRNYADRGQLLNDSPDWVPWPAHRRRVELVDAGYGEPADLAGKDLKGKLAVLRWGDDWAGSYIWTHRVRNLAVAGATGYIAVSSPPAGREHSTSYSTPTNFIGHHPDGPAHIELPEVQARRDQGMKLLQMLERGPVRVDLNADPNIRYTYQLSPAVEQQIPQSLDYVFDERQLRTVDSAFHGSDPYVLRTTVVTTVKGAATSGTAGWTMNAMGPGTRIDYVGPTDPKVLVVSSHRILSGGPDITWRKPTAVTEPGRTTERWFLPVTAPGSIDMDDGYAAAPVYTRFWCMMCRENNVLWPFTVDGYRDGTSFEGQERIGNQRLYREDGTEIPLTPIPEALNIPGYPLPAEAATYRLVQHDPGQQTTWTFRSAAPTGDTSMPGVGCVGRAIGLSTTCAPQQVLFLGYDLGSALRQDNTVRAGRAHLFTVFAYHPRSQEDMPKVAGLRVWTSTDDGATWQPARVGLSHDGAFTVMARYPRLSATTGAVSIKAEAWDAAGGRIEQVLTRAVPLAAR